VNLSKHPDYSFADDDITAAAVDECRVCRLSDRIGEREFPAEDVSRRIRLREVCDRGGC